VGRRLVIPSGRSFFDPGADVTNPSLTAAAELTTARQHFYLPRKVADPFDHSALVDYDVTICSSLARATCWEYGCRRLRLPGAAAGARDQPNRNRTATAFDALGMVVATAVMGKDTERLGDLLEGFDADPPLAIVQAFTIDPQAQAVALLERPRRASSTTSIVINASANRPLSPCWRARRTSAILAALRPEFRSTSSTPTALAGRSRKSFRPKRAMRRSARPTSPVAGDIRPGDLILDPQRAPVPAHALRRWVGTGRTVFNNKGKPVRQYEPFFSATHLYEPEREMTDTGSARWSSTTRSCVSWPRCTPTTPMTRWCSTHGSR